MIFLPVELSERNEVLRLLQKAALPVADINSQIELFALRHNDHMLGIIGLEANGPTGLLRSLCVDEAARGKGYGAKLVQSLEKIAKEKGIESLYLLTTTAAPFFSKRGYTTISRAEAPPIIQQTSEFASVCPASATVMKKDIS